MNENEKIEILKSLEHIISFNIKKIFNYRLADYEDLMQEARMLIYNKLDKYDDSKANLPTFCQILIKNNLVNLTISQYRNWDKVSIDSEKVYLSKEIEEKDNDCSKYLFELEGIIKIHQSYFSPTELKFLELFIQRKTFKQIEVILNITANHRLQLCFTIKNKIKKILKGEK